VSLGLLAFIVVGVIPQFASYSSAWTRMSDLGAWWWVGIGGAAVLSQISGIWPYQAALPGLRFRDGLIQIETATAISSTVPAGSAVAVGMTYKMFASFGYPNLLISSAVITTGVWAFAMKIGLPIVAVALLAITAHASREVVTAAIVGVLFLTFAGLTLHFIFRSERTAHWIGELADRVANWTTGLFRRPPANRIERALIRFERQTIQTVHHRGWLLTIATIGNQLAAFALVLIIVRAVGMGSAQVSVAAVLTAFAVSRLAGAIPITPGGLGTLDATFISVMTASGAHPAQALAVDLIWRLTTYFLPIFPGALTYLIWIRSRRHVVAIDPGDVPVTAAATA
jgi:putative heme transporter